MLSQGWWLMNLILRLGGGVLNFIINQDLTIVNTCLQKLKLVKYVISTSRMLSAKAKLFKLPQCRRCVCF